MGVWAATASNLQAGSFFRLNVVELRLPALRERKEDVPLLANEFMQSCAQKINIGIRA